MGTRLHVTLVRSRYVEGKKHQQHVAHLGSVELPMTVEGRLAFWERTHQRFIERVDKPLAPEELQEIFVAMERRIPLPKISEMDGIREVGGEVQLKLWKNAIERHESQIRHFRTVKADAERKIEELLQETARVRVQIENLERASNRLTSAEELESRLQQLISVQEFAHKGDQAN